MKPMKLNSISCALMAASLQACTVQEPEVAPAVTEQMPPQRLENVESRATASRGVVEVKPLTAPEVTVLVDAALAADAAGRGPEARDLLTEALSLAPDDPQVWQRYAELSLKHGDFEAAINAAERSYRVGPQVGELCSRNWLTIAEAHSAMGQDGAAADASAQSESCPVRARERI